MIGTARRKIAEQKIRNANCEHCNESDSLMVTVYSKFFMLKILPFVMRKTTEINCKNCQKNYTGERLEASLQRKVDGIKEDAKHPWFLYIGYAILIFGLFAGLTMDPPK